MPADTKKCIVAQCGEQVSLRSKSGLCPGCSNYVRYWRDRQLADIRNRLMQVERWRNRLQYYIQPKKKYGQ